jgi:peroxiredoxin
MRTGLWLATLALTALAGGAGWALQEAKPDEAEGKLLAVGVVAPDFTLPLVGGGDVTLAQTLKGIKAALVVFWGIEDEGGGADLPKLKKLHEQLEAKGLALILVNPVDDLSDVRRIARKADVELQVAIDGKETNRAVTHVYKAKKLPTYYLLDPHGKVVFRSIGLKEGPLAEALNKAGIPAAKP